MNTIVIPTDFSPVAENALHYAINMAKEIGTSVTLVHVYQIPVSMTDTPVVMVSGEELKLIADERVKELKKDVEHITSGKVKVYTEVRLGNIVDELEDLCKQIKPFAIVMGTKGSSAVDRILFGNTTLIVIRDFTWPVIIVPPGSVYKSIKKIGFACDFRQVIETTPTPYIKEIVKTFHAELHVLNVDFENRHFKPGTPEESLLLHTMLEDLNPEYHFIENLDVEAGINEFAEKNNLDLLITIPKKHKLLQGLFKKSHTRKLVFESHVPIMCVHE
jgi:nucleotide-binding universal stress UspA family protein